MIIIFGFEILEAIIHSVGRCRGCNSKRPLIVENKSSLDMGFSSKITMSCTNCSWAESYFTSKETKDCPFNYGKSGDAAKGRTSFEINVRMISAFREIGKGFEPLKNFARVANLKGLSLPCFTNIKTKLMKSYKVEADESMTKAAASVYSESKKSSVSGAGLCRVSFDGSCNEEDMPR